MFILLDYKDVYILLVVVLLLVQCIDERVNKVIFDFFDLVDNFFDMVKVEVEDIKVIICFCGFLLRKLKVIFDFFKIFIEEYNGEVLEDMVLLEKLLGVGYKIVFVVMLQVFGVLVFLVDIYIYWLVYCWIFSIGKNVEKIECDLKCFFLWEIWNKLYL